MTSSVPPCLRSSLLVSALETPARAERVSMRRGPVSPERPGHFPRMYLSMTFENEFTVKPSGGVNLRPLM